MFRRGCNALVRDGPCRSVPRGFLCLCWSTRRRYAYPSRRGSLCRPKNECLLRAPRRLCARSRSRSMVRGADDDALAYRVLDCSQGRSGRLTPRGSYLGRPRRDGWRYHMLARATWTRTLRDLSWLGHSPAVGVRAWPLARANRDRGGVGDTSALSVGVRAPAESRVLAQQSPG